MMASRASHPYEALDTSRRRPRPIAKCAACALAAVAGAKLASLPPATTQADGSYVGELLASFVAEKRRVLTESAAALSK